MYDGKVGRHVWAVGALCRALTDALQARFQPLAVRGEISGLSWAASGHGYFTLKDLSGQLRCVMFRRAASQLAFLPREGMQVEVCGQLAVYEQRGDLQLIVESMRSTGEGVLFEQFLHLKTQLTTEGLFDVSRKRALPPWPRGIGLVTSLGAAALHDVLAALGRRASHIPVVLAPAQVQGADAPVSICTALSALYAWVRTTVSAKSASPVFVDVILLVRGGGSLEDLWAFNNELLARTIGQSPVPVVTGIGHETDFSIADFCADLRAPTPTAAAELVAQSRLVALAALDVLGQRLQTAVQRRLEMDCQRLDQLSHRLGQPSAHLLQYQAHLRYLVQRMHHVVQWRLQAAQQQCQVQQKQWTVLWQQIVGEKVQRLERIALRLNRLDPRWNLQRGYVFLTDPQGVFVSSIDQAPVGTQLQATLSDGVLDVLVTQRPSL